MNNAPFSPFRILASASRSATTYGGVLKRPRGANALQLWFNVTAITTTSLQLRIKGGMDSAKMGPDSGSTAIGSAITTVSSLATGNNGSTTAQSITPQIYVTHSDAAACTYELWGCWTGPEN